MRIVSDETRKKMSESRKKIMTPERRKQISESQIGREPHNKGKFGSKVQNYLNGEPNFCEIHGLHTDFVYYPKNRCCQCRLCKLDISRRHQKAPENKLKRIYQYTRYRSKKLGWEFNLTIEDLNELYEKQKGLCALSGIEMSRETNHIHSVSIDKIDANGKYTKDNIQLLAFSINRMKSDFDQNEFIEMCKKIANLSK